MSIVDPKWSIPQYASQYVCFEAGSGEAATRMEPLEDGGALLYEESIEIVINLFDFVKRDYLDSSN